MHAARLLRPLVTMFRQLVVLLQVLRAGMSMSMGMSMVAVLLRTLVNLLRHLVSLHRLVVVLHLLGQVVTKDMYGQAVVLQKSQW